MSDLLKSAEDAAKSAALAEVNKQSGWLRSNIKPFSIGAGAVALLWLLTYLL